jgi:predicted negative regulator of RcsB-dependent stress response
VLVSLAQTLEGEQRRGDLLIERGQLGAAIAALEATRGLEWPTRALAGDEVVILRHDFYGRLLRLRIDNPELDALDDDALLERADEGLGDDEEVRAVRTNPFTARLVAIRGEVLDHAGRDDDALGAYEVALEMNRALLQQALTGALPGSALDQGGAP